MIWYYFIIILAKMIVIDDLHKSVNFINFFNPIMFIKNSNNSTEIRVYNII